MSGGKLIEAGGPRIISAENLASDSSADYLYARSSIYSALERAQDLLERAHAIASESDHPRAISVATELVTAIVTSSEKLLDIQSKIQKLQKDIVNSETPTNITPSNNDVTIKLSSLDLYNMLQDMKAIDHDELQKS